MIHIGKLLQNYFETKRTRKAVLARLLQININSLMNYEKKESIQTKRLLEICTHLQHNFFMDIAMQLPQEYTTQQNPFEAKDLEIAQLKEALKKAETERDVLLNILKK